MLRKTVVAQVRRSVVSFEESGNVNSDCLSARNTKQQNPMTTFYQVVWGWATVCALHGDFKHLQTLFLDAHDQHMLSESYVNCKKTKNKTEPWWLNAFILIFFSAELHVFIYSFTTTPKLKDKNPESLYVKVRISTTSPTMSHEQVWPQEKKRNEHSKCVWVCLRPGARSRMQV